MKTALIGHPKPESTFSYKSRAGQFEFSVIDKPKEEQVLIRDKSTMHDVLLTKSAWETIGKLKGWAI